MKKWLIPAGLLSAAGIALLPTPIRFTGLLLLCAAAMLAVFGALRNKKAARRVVAVCTLLGLVLFAAAEIQVIRYSRTDDSGKPDAIIVLGAGVYGTVPSLSLRVRLEAARDYSQAHPGIPIVVSGGQGPGEDISEAECMAGWLTDNGVDPERIIQENKSTSTEENIDNSFRLLGEMGIDSNIAIVSADYHLYRASLYCGAAEIIPVAATLPGRWWPMTLNYYIREAFGAVYFWLFHGISGA